jgi:hypothetical protein
MSHPIKATGRGKRLGVHDAGAPPVPSWPSYQGTSQLVGTSPTGRLTVYVDPSLGPPGLQNAQDLVNDGDRVCAANDQFFGTQGQPVSVIIFAIDDQTDGTGGADHATCDYVNGGAIEVCAAFGNAARVSALFEAELSECSMGGNLCGLSTGEALSRWLAAVISGNALADFATAPQWWQAGMPDYVNQTAPTDTDRVSIGCGMAFLSWLMSQGHGLDKIAPAMVSLGDSGTLAQLYAQLTSDQAGNAWPAFTDAVNNLSGITNDDPFGGAGQPAQIAHLAPWSIELAGRIFAAILSDVAAAKSGQQMVATVQAVLTTAPSSRRAGAAQARVTPKGHRLK